MKSTKIVVGIFTLVSSLGFADSLLTNPFETGEIVNLDTIESWHEYPSWENRPEAPFLQAGFSGETEGSPQGRPHGRPPGKSHPPGKGGGRHHGPRLTDQQRQIFEQCLTENGITPPPPPGQESGTRPAPPSEAQRAVFHSCHQKAQETAAGESSSIDSFNTTQQQALWACMQQQGYGNNSGNSPTAIAENCRASILGE